MVAPVAIFILGMHRSGTSALSRVLSLLGASLPRHVLPPGPGNETGHWEPEPAGALNERVLAAAGAAQDGLTGPPDAWFATAEAEAFVTPMQALLRDEFAGASLFVFKDPRSALVFPLWRRAAEGLGMRCLATVITRNPAEVARSLADRQARTVPGQSWPMDRGGLLWLRYALAAERHSRDCARAFCTYDDLLTDWQGVARRIATDLGIAWPRTPAEVAPEVARFLDPRHRHQHAGQPLAARGGIWASWIAPAFDALRQRQDAAVLDAVARSFADACTAVLEEPGDQQDRDPAMAGILAISAVHAAILSEASREASDRAEVLAGMLAARTEAALSAERYAQSLEAALEETRASRDAAIDYARSLEQARERAEAYARQLEAHLARAAGPETPE